MSTIISITDAPNFKLKKLTSYEYEGDKSGLFNHFNKDGNGLSVSVHSRPGLEFIVRCVDELLKVKSECKIIGALVTDRHGNCNFNCHVLKTCQNTDSLFYMLMIVWLDYNLETAILSNPFNVLTKNNTTSKKDDELSQHSETKVAVVGTSPGGYGLPQIMKSVKDSVAPVVTSLFLTTLSITYEPTITHSGTLYKYYQTTGRLHSKYEYPRSNLYDEIKVTDVTHFLGSAEEDRDVQSYLGYHTVKPENEPFMYHCSHQRRAEAQSACKGAVISGEPTQSRNHKTKKKAANSAAGQSSHNTQAPLPPCTAERLAGV